jgi:hypothetical protein
MLYSTEGGGPAPGESGPGRHGTGIVWREGTALRDSGFRCLPQLQGSHKQEKVIVDIGPCTEVLSDHRLVLRTGGLSLVTGLIEASAERN